MNQINVITKMIDLKEHKKQIITGGMRMFEVLARWD